MKRLHQDYNYGGKYFLKPDDAVRFVQEVGGISFLSDRLIKRIYGFSK